MVQSTEFQVDFYLFIFYYKRVVVFHIKFYYFQFELRNNAAETIKEMDRKLFICVTHINIYWRVESRTLRRGGPGPWPFKYLNICELKIMLHTVVSDYIKTMKTTFDSNFELFQAVKQHGYTNKEVQGSCQLKKLHFDYFQACYSKKAC